uniref:Uncharacterized protein n=1 Tax=Eucampia antarctica TaxID=49252 RepID=A0A7S2W1R2_9STRA|mmetsp:Transcript_17571/g.17030  ORF Transcript_17571/g.17030 Transcript_17571/m.17030 type:complete len:157 (+) Transcript_17571:115-585(+)
MIDEQDYHDEDPSPLIDGDSLYENSDDEEIVQEEGEILGGDWLQDQLIENATHDVVQIGSETTDDEIRSEIHSDESFSDVEENDSDSANSECASTGYNLRSKNNRDYSHWFNHAMDNPTSNQSYDVQMLQDSVTQIQERVGNNHDILVNRRRMSKK